MAQNAVMMRRTSCGWRALMLRTYRVINRLFIVVANDMSSSPLC